LTRVVYAISLIALMSCATVVSGPKESIAVDSEPSGSAATIECDGQFAGHGVTPAKIEIPRRADKCTVHVELSGFVAADVELDRAVNKKYWLNLATIPLVLIGVAEFNGILFDRPDSSSRMRGAACLLAAGAVWATDRHTGAMHEHQPQKVMVTLKPRP
jgi:hypothetical protein